jgi:iduronate 2-sulfatase
MDVFQTRDGDDDIYPDGLITNEAMKQLNELTADKSKPFFLAVGIIKPHLPFGAPKSYFDQYDHIELPAIDHPQKPVGRTTWHNSNEFKRYNTWGKEADTDSIFADNLRKHYAACVSYADEQVGKILRELKRTGADKNTIIVLWGDHGWHLGEHAIWGKHSLFEESLRSPMIIHYPGMKNENSDTNAIVETLDIYPTLCDLTGLEIPKFAQGISLRTIMENPNSAGHLGYSYIKNAKTVRTATHRLILHKDNYLELYDHTTMEGETKNIANEQPVLAEELKIKIINRFKNIREDPN